MAFVRAVVGTEAFGSLNNFGAKAVKPVDNPGGGVELVHVTIKWVCQRCGVQQILCYNPERCHAAVCFKCRASYTVATTSKLIPDDPGAPS